MFYFGFALSPSSVTTRFVLHRYSFYITTEPPTSGIGIAAVEVIDETEEATPQKERARTIRARVEKSGLSAESVEAAVEQAAVSPPPDNRSSVLVTAPVVVSPPQGAGLERRPTGRPARPRAVAPAPEDEPFIMPEASGRSTSLRIFAAYSEMYPDRPIAGLFTVRESSKMKGACECGPHHSHCWGFSDDLST